MFGKCMIYEIICENIYMYVYTNILRTVKINIYIIFLRKTLIEKLYILVDALNIIYF